MRRFRVGDRVRFELSVDGAPRWYWEVDGGGCGQFVEGTVTYAGAKMFEVDYALPDGWSWPQPDHHDARYGAPGYLELVKAVEDQQTEYDEYIAHHQPPRLTKTMTVDEVTEMVENLLVERTEALLNPPPLPAICRYAATLERYREISKERARAVAEALVGVRVTR